jgi:UrcA family protein
MIQMTQLTARFVGLATLALAALPMAAVATSVRAEPASVRVADLDLSRTEGVAAYHQRVASAAEAHCRQSGVAASALSQVAACKAGVRAELVQKLSAVQQAQAGRTSVLAWR